MPPSRSTTSALPAAADALGNLYSRQLQQQRRAAVAAREMEALRGLRRNADAAAFDSLMRVRRRGGRAGNAWMQAPTPPSSVTSAFEGLVADRLDQTGIGAGRLAYADRLALFRRASAMGLSRFDANLLIARVQHYRHGASARRHNPVEEARLWRRERWRAWRRWLVWGLLGFVLLTLQASLLPLWRRVLGF